MGPVLLFFFYKLYLFNKLFLKTFSFIDIRRFLVSFDLMY